MEIIANDVYKNFQIPSLVAYTMFKERFQTSNLAVKFY